MKFLCVPCDTPMRLRNVEPPERGSLAVVYSCPACGYEMAMLTNSYETQVVQSLGVRIGPKDGEGLAADAGRPAPDAARLAAESGCPFAAMVPGATAAPQATTIGWTAAAEARLANIPSFVRPMARVGIEQFARERGVAQVDETILDAARDHFGM